MQDTKRPTEQPKDESITFRIPRDLKRQLRRVYRRRGELSALLCRLAAEHLRHRGPAA